MFALVSRDRIELPPGAVMRLLGTWQDYITLSEQRGDGSIPRMKYRDGEILLMSPLPIHGQGVSLLGDIVKTILDHLGQEYNAYTPVTMTLPEAYGIEPDICFYIDNWQISSGKERIDWQVDPPFDLVIEMDVTSYSSADDYLPFKVPEVWMFKKKQLRIYGLENDAYIPQERSRFFPEMPIFEVVAECVQIASERSTSAAIRTLRQRLNRE
ncbi:Uma2 family endonuclease [Leptolyngbya sp. NIES-2104]|uniref:Uma2 family endonuclease n=1 Tax=Leptolyngbya sp. NIES-2104 TaxID=1552121 RepID=UPI0006EC4D86|nr:Uma2 family endonuclease [Leptolyngbya sp. NIES-2104]GAP98928.1 flavodoxin reductase (ferredoxin-NADPH reductase) family 1 [Leptolyngbya sp. NIES-2104]